MFFSTVTLLGARSSIEMRTRSVPLMMKYPPGSSGSSPAFSRSFLYDCASSLEVEGERGLSSTLLACRLQRADLTMIGRFPMCTLSSSSGRGLSSLTILKSR